MTHSPENSSFSFPLNSNCITIGRDPESDILLHALGVSRYHAQIKLLPDGPRISDLGSTFGIRINQEPVKDKILSHRDIVTIGVVEFNVIIENDTLLLKRKRERISPEAIPELKDTDIIKIGRDTTNTICLSHPLVSRYHCTVHREKDGRYSLADHGSTNGTFVNGHHIHHATLEDGDIVQIGPFRFMLDEGKFVQADDSRRIKLEAQGITVRRDGRKLLDRISLSIQPGEFVAILGPSGAGKTTLAKVLTGQLPADSGTVYYNGFPLNRFAAAFSSAVGFVSQHNLLRPELTVRETFMEQVLLRLPKDSLEAERIARINEVIDMLEISSISGSRISNLSGGEAKRVHLGIELLSSPTIIFLDEPLAGLDPGLTGKFMELFKKLCGKGYTLLLTTHTLEQIDLCDRLFFVSNGKLVYQGVPQNTIDVMNVASLAEVYEKVRSGKEFVPPVVEEKVTIDEHEERIRGLKAQKYPFRRPQAAGFFRQLVMLTSRYAKVLFRDLTNLVLIILQAPLIAFLLALVFNGDSRFLPLSFYFCVTISAIWIGGVNSVREIAREKELFEREFRAGLSTVAYVTSKCIVFTLLGFGQAVLFTLSIHWSFEAYSFNLETILLCTVITISGTILGLCISAFSGNVNRAVSLLPILFIPQIFFSGILIPFDRMPDLGRIISYLTISRPGFSMFKKICILEQSIGKLAEWKSLFLLNSILIVLIMIRMRWHHFFTKSGR